MSAISLSEHKQKLLITPELINLSQLFDRGTPHYGYWMRPANKLQSQQMVAAYIESAKSEMKNGGYIFVKRSRAPDVLRQLVEANLEYKAVHLKDMAELEDILDLQAPSALWVIVEDDSLPYEVQASRFQAAQKALRHKMAPPLGTHISMSEVSLTSPRKTFYTVLMFIEMDYPSIRGFSVILSQARSLKIASCRISMEGAHDQEVSQLFGSASTHPDELKARALNNYRVFGTGPRHRLEYLPLLEAQIDDLARSLARSSGLAPGAELISEVMDICTQRLEQESNLGIAFLEGTLVMLDLAK